MRTSKYFWHFKTVFLEKTKNTTFLQFFYCLFQMQLTYIIGTNSNFFWTGSNQQNSTLVKVLAEWIIATKIFTNTGYSLDKLTRLFHILHN